MLDYCTKRGHGHKGKHLKSGIYKGKFSEVKHSQYIYKSTVKQGIEGNEEATVEKVVDTRPEFDNRVKDDMIRHDDTTDIEHAKANLETLRLAKTRSCPEMGAEFMFR